MPDGRDYHAEFWQLGPSYHMTIFVPRQEGESAEDAAEVIEESLIEFSGTRYRRIEPFERGGIPVWSYNVVVCDDQEQFVARLPQPSELRTLTIWHQNRQSVFPLRR
ncbi:MAG: hypothetical protein AB7J35_04010 [Dehalococcoidia bacterium]